MSQAVAPGPVSLASLAYLLVLYLVYTVRLELERGDYLRVWRGYAALMVVPAVLVFAQYGWQLRAGPGSALGLDFLFPQRLVLPGYVYRSSSGVLADLGPAERRLLPRAVVLLGLPGARLPQRGAAAAPAVVRGPLPRRAAFVRRRHGAAAGGDRHRLAVALFAQRRDRRRRHGAPSHPA